MNWIFLSLLSAFFAGLSSVFSKKIMKKNISAKQILFERYIIMLFFSFLIFNKFISFSSIYEYWHLFVLKALTVGFFSILYLKLLKDYDISLVNPLLNLSPLFLLVLSSIFLGERPTGIQIIGILIILIGIYILEMSVNFPHISKLRKIHFSNFKNPKRYNWKFINLVTLMLFTISICAIADKKIMDNGVSSFTNVYYTALIISIMIISYFISKKEFLVSIKKIYSYPSVFVLSFFELVSELLILQAISLPNILVSLAIPIKRTSTLFSSIFGGFLFHENHLMKKSFGIVIMLFGVFLIAF